MSIMLQILCKYHMRSIECNLYHNVSRFPGKKPRLGDLRTLSRSATAKCRAEPGFVLSPNQSWGQSESQRNFCSRIPQRLGYCLHQGALQTGVKRMSTWKEWLKLCVRRCGSRSTLQQQAAVGSSLPMQEKAGVHSLDRVKQSASLLRDTGTLGGSKQAP